MIVGGAWGQIEGSKVTHKSSTSYFPNVVVLYNGDPDPLDAQQMLPLPGLGDVVGGLQHVAVYDPLPVALVPTTELMYIVNSKKALYWEKASTTKH